MSLKYSGVKTLKKNLLKLAKEKGPSAYGKIVLRALVLIENNSAKRTPVDKGHLKLSGLGHSKLLASAPNGAMGYTTNTADYAIYVHERLDLKHTVGEAKFLEKAVNEIKPKIEKKFGAELRSEMFTKDMA